MLKHPSLLDNAKENTQIRCDGLIFTLNIYRIHNCSSKNIEKELEQVIRGLILDPFYCIPNIYKKHCN